MKRLACILGIVALCSSVFLGISGIIAHRGVQRSSSAVDKAQADLAEVQASANLETMSRNTAIEADEAQVQNDDLDIQIAELKDESIAKLVAKRTADKMQLTMAETFQSLHELDSSLGPDPQVSSAMERVQAAQLSLSVYSAVLTRDERLAYAAGVVWLAFGFAVALGSKERGTATRREAAVESNSNS